MRMYVNAQKYTLTHIANIFSSLPVVSCLCTVYCGSERQAIREFFVFVLMRTNSVFWALNVRQSGNNFTFYDFTIILFHIFKL